MAKYLVRRPNGRIEGPYTSSELRTIAHEGRLSADDMVSPEGESNWVSTMRVRGIREILDLLAPPAPSPRVEPAIPAGAAMAAGSALPSDDDDPYGIASLPPVARRSAAGSRIADKEIPNYSVLRCVAGWLSAYGWIIVALTLGAAIFIACKWSFEFLAGDIEMEFLAVLLIASLVLGFVFAQFMRKGSHSKPVNPWFIALVMLPLVPALLTALRAGVIKAPAMLGLFMTPPLMVVGSLLVTLVGGMLLIAIGQFAVAHADIATNSWKRLD